MAEPQLEFEEKDDDNDDDYDARILIRETESQKYILAKPREQQSRDKKAQKDLCQRMIRCLQKDNFAMELLGNKETIKLFWVE